LLHSVLAACCSLPCSGLQGLTAANGQFAYPKRSQPGNFEVARAPTKSKLLIIGVDAGSPELFQHWCAEGDLPNVQRLLDTGTYRSVQNPRGLEAGSVWPVFQSGLMPGHQPQYDGRRVFDPAHYSSRWFGPDETPPTLWRQLSENGIRSLLIDPPYTHLDPAVLGTMVVDWSGHVPANGHTFHFAAHPPAVAVDIRRVIGEAPGSKVMCDRMGAETVSDYRRFRDLYLERIAMKGRLATHLLTSTTWDVAMIVSSDLHCTGHHLWHINDPRHPQYSARLEAALGEPIRDCYRAFDASLGQIIASVPADTIVMLFGSHGMGPSYSGTGLLDRILQRIDAGSPAGASRSAKGNLRALWHRVPKETRGWLKPLRRPFKGMLRPVTFVGNRQNRRCFEVHANNATGGIRLNIKGREASGTVAAEDAAALQVHLIRELRAIVNTDSGEPLVADVIVSSERYPGMHQDQLPDLLVIWNRSAPIRQVHSATIGTLVQQNPDNRTGDHTPDGFCVVRSLPNARQEMADTIRTVDFAPTIAEFFEVRLRAQDGQVFPLTTSRCDGVHVD
jgi:predicted AlkP superfamily phosphohydrolase/phosphomutase